MTIRRLTAGHGIALPAVLFALVSLGLLAAALFFVAAQEMRSGRNAVLALRALVAAESTADSLVSLWNAAVYSSIGVGGGLDISLGRDGERAGVAARLIRTGERYFLIQVESTVGEARQLALVMVRLEGSACDASTPVNCSPITSSAVQNPAHRMAETWWVSTF